MVSVVRDGVSSVSTTTRYRLVAPDRSVVVPELDEHQQRVVDHEGGPLLVLAGPGTGKTTTLVEAIVDRIEHRGASPDSVRSTIASTSVVVLPVPGPARTRSGPPSWSTTRCWCSSSSGTTTSRSGRTNR